MKTHCPNPNCARHVLLYVPIKPSSRAVAAIGKPGTFPDFVAFVVKWFRVSAVGHVHVAIPRPSAPFQTVPGSGKCTTVEDGSQRSYWGSNMLGYSPDYLELKNPAVQRFQQLLWSQNTWKAYRVNLDSFVYCLACLFIYSFHMKPPPHLPCPPCGCKRSLWGGALNRSFRFQSQA